VVSEVDLGFKGYVFESRLIQITRWKWDTAMPGSIPALPNSNSFDNKINTGSQMGHNNNKKEKNLG